MGATNYTTNSDMLTLLALRVKEYRLAARMSQKELAEQSGVSQTTISHFEQGVSRNPVSYTHLTLPTILLV